MFWKIKEKKECEPCMNKRIKLADKYSISTLHDAFDKILMVSMALPQDKGGYTCEYLGARCGIDPTIVKDVMMVLCHIGVFKRCGNDPDYYILKSGKITNPVIGVP